MYELDLKDTLDLLDIHIDYCQKITKFHEQRQLKKFRAPNFPEHISENIIRNLIEQLENVKCTRNNKSGDLSKEGIRVECKSFSSAGPCSFGPNEKWNEIYFLDARNYITKKFKLYRVKLSNDDKIFLNLKVNKKQTFEDQAKLGRRPRITFNEIYKQLKSNIELIYDDQLNIL
jgi:hypothetical protein